MSLRGIATVGAVTITAWRAAPRFNAFNKSVRRLLGRSKSEKPGRQFDTKFLGETSEVREIAEIDSLKAIGLQNSNGKGRADAKEIGDLSDEFSRKELNERIRCFISYCDN